MAAATSGDGGASWLRRALTRVKEQAEEQGRSMEEVAAERWGSLEKLKSMIAAAETKGVPASSSASASSTDNRKREYAADRRRDDRRSGRDDTERVYTSSESNRRRRGHDQDFEERPRGNSHSPEKDAKSSRYDSPNDRRKQSKFWHPDDESSKERHKQRAHASESARSDRKTKSFVPPAMAEPDSGSDSSEEREEARDHKTNDAKIKAVEAEEQEVAGTSAKEEMEEIDLNKLSAKIMKAEMMGNTELAKKLKLKLEAARNAPQKQQQRGAGHSNATRSSHSGKSSKGDRQQKSGGDTAKASVDEILWKTNARTGFSMPMLSAKSSVFVPAASTSADASLPVGLCAASDVQTEMRKLMADERNTTGEDVDYNFVKMAAGTANSKLNDDFQVDDAMLSKKRKATNKQIERDAEANKREAIEDQRRMDSTVSNCKFCIDSPRMLKHLTVAMGLKTYLALPAIKSLTEGHCLIIPMTHAPCATALDEDVWQEMLVWRKGLVAMFRSQDLDCLFIETALRLQHFNHMCIECIPVPVEMGDMAPIYFKKAFMECDEVWAQNKRVVDLAAKGGIRKSVPKGFPYVSVDFGLQNGFAHVIENEAMFPGYFVKEIIGRMLDLDHLLWRKPTLDSLADQSKKVIKFCDEWKDYDWTAKVKQALTKSEGDTGIEEMNETLGQLEHLLNEFFAPTTSNARKQEIENLLQHFRRQSESLDVSIHIVAASENVFVQMFALQTLQELVDAKWLFLGADQKMRIRSAVKHSLFDASKASTSNARPNFIVNKQMKLLADITRLDWLENDQDYFEELLKLVHEPQFVLTALKLLQTTLEETHANADRSLYSFYTPERAKAFSDHFQAKVFPRLFACLSDIMHQVALEFCGRFHPLVAAAHSRIINNNSLHNSVDESFSLGFASLSLSFDENQMFASTRTLLKRLKNASPNAISLAEKAMPEFERAVLSALFPCIGQLFQWLPNLSYLSLLPANASDKSGPAGAMLPSHSSKLLPSIFLFAYFGIHDSAGSSRASDSFFSGLTSAALQSILELLPRFFVPDASLHCLSRLFLEFFCICLQELLPDCSLPVDIYDISDFDVSKLHSVSLNATFQSRLVELHRLFLQQHWHRHYTSALSNSDEDLLVQRHLQFLTAFTVGQTEIESFGTCLELRNIILDFLATREGKPGCRFDDEKQKFQVALTRLAVGILQKLLPSQNKLLTDWFDLDEMSLETEDSEWSQLVNSCSEVFGKVGDFYPVEMLNFVERALDKRRSIYLGLQTLITTFPAVPNEASLLNCLVDMQVLLRFADGLAHLFINENFWNFLPAVRPFIENVCHAAVYSKKYDFFLLPASSSLKLQFTKTLAALLLALRSFAHWISQFYAEAQRRGEFNVDVTMIISTVIDVCIPLIQPQIPEILIHAAVSCLHSTLTTVRPQQYILSVSSFHKLYEQSCSLELLKFPAKINRCLYCCLANYLILPWYNAVDEEQEWSRRKGLYQKMMKALLQDFSQLCSTVAAAKQGGGALNLNEYQVRQSLAVIDLLNDMLDGIANESTKTKQLCFGVLKAYANDALSLLEYFSASPEIAESLLSFIVALFNTLIVQLGAEFTQRTVQVFVALTQKQVLSDVLTAERSLGCKILVHLLKVLLMIVKELNKPFIQFIVSSLNLVLCNILPLLTQAVSIDVKSSLYHFLFVVLDVRWRYFFPPKPTRTDEENSQSTALLTTAALRTEHLTQILRAFGTSLEDSEISIIKQNLRYLNDLHVKWGLFKKEIFVKLFFRDFARAFFYLMLSQGHAMLVEDFAETLCNMVLVSDDCGLEFRQTVLPLLLREVAGLHEGQVTQSLQRFRLEKDVPSFRTEIERLICDVRLFRMYNNEHPSQ